MDHDVLRFLLFSAQQQHQQGAGLTAQLHALRLKCAAQAEQSQAAGQDQALFSDLSEECSKLLLATTGAAAGQAADARCACQRIAPCSHLHIYTPCLKWRPPPVQGCEVCSCHVSAGRGVAAVPTGRQPGEWRNWLAVTRV